MNRAITVVAIVVASGGMWRCRQSPAAVPPESAAKVPEYAVTLMFDGGYVFLHDEANKSLTVSAFDAGHPTDRMGTGSTAMAAHSLRMRLDTGTIVSMPDTLKPTLDAPATWDLNDAKYDITFARYGATAPGVVMPRSTAIDASDPCNRAPKNNLQLMPALDELASQGGFDGKLSLDRQRYQNRVIVTHGTFSVAELTSCLDFRVVDKSVAKHRVPNGLGGIHVDFKMQEDLTVTVTDMNGKARSLVFGPTKDALGRERLLIWFGRFPLPCGPTDPGCGYAKGEELTDFARFYALLVKPAAKAQQVMPFNASDRDEVCPGSQCPSMYVRVKQQ